MIYNEKYNDLSDEEILSRFNADGDNLFVGILYQRYGHLALGLCIKYLRNKDEAQDAVIQIFGNLITDLKKHKVSYFKSWLYVYTRNFCLMELRKRQSTLKKDLELHENRHLFMDYGESEHLKEKELQITMLEQAVDELNEEQKRCIRLFYMNNKSYGEIVSLTGYSANDVKSYIQNGKRNLKIKIEALMNGQAKKQ